MQCRMACPNLLHLPMDKYSWDNTVYRDVKEEIPKDIPELKGNTVDTTTYVDANLLDDMISSKPVTGVMYFLNQTPIDSYSKKQNMVGTHGSRQWLTLCHYHLGSASS